MDSTNNFQHHEQQHQQHQQQQQQHHHHHHHLLQDHFAVCSPSINHPSSSPTSFALSTSFHWNPTILSTTTSSDTFCNKVYENESSYEQVSSTNLFPKTEEDMLSSFPSFTTLINSPNAHNMMENSCSFNGFSLNNNNNININTRGLMNFPLDQQHQPNYRDVTPWINSSHGFPSSNNILQQLGLVSSPNHSATSVSSCSPRLGLNMQAMDLLGVNTTFGTHVLHEEAFSPLGKNTPNNKALAPTNGIAGTKRAAGSSSSDQSKASTTNNTIPNKKSLLKVSCPPLKVRKEKLGDRIAALHQLVSPFGKTDTASVLTEAIGYIQFLQDQIHTLFMPHPKPPSRNNLIGKPFQLGVASEDDGKDEDKSQIDIRERGLCLVPLSWTSYISPNQFDTSNTPFF